MLYVAGLDNIEKKDQLNGIIKINYYKNNYFLDFLCLVYYSKKNFERKLDYII